MNFRYRCSCGNVYDNPGQSAVCPQCQRMNSTDGCGIVEVYRMGNFAGMAVGMGLYVDEQPFGHVANKGCIKLVVPYGQHKLHATLSTLRRSNNPTIMLTPEQPALYFKVTQPFMANILNFNPVSEADMPNK